MLDMLTKSQEAKEVNSRHFSFEVRVKDKWTVDGALSGSLYWQIEG